MVTGATPLLPHCCLPRGARDLHDHVNSMGRAGQDEVHLMAGRDAVAGGSLAAGAHRERGIDLAPVVVCARCGVTVGWMGGDGWW